ncbi:MAG: hypothetical protein ABSG37_05455 [Candidatus Limnocylindrales bacterium]
MRVRQFELRLLAVALTVLWAAGGGIVLIAYRPGGPVDLLVGVAASLPLLISVAAIVWPPLVLSDRGAAGVFWLGLIAALMLVPSIAAVTGQVIQGGTEPLLPSLEVIYPWALALLATSLFAGIGLGRRVIPEAGIGKRRLAVSLAFALAATSIIGGIFAAVSLADNAALSNMPAAHSEFGPTAANLTPPECDRAFVTGGTGSLEIDLWADVDGRSAGTVNLSGVRSGSDLSWTAQVVRSDLFGEYGAVRIGSSAWTLSPGRSWTVVRPEATDGQDLDVTVLANALSPDNRATAEDRGLEYVDGARARHCRVAVDGPTFAASFPQVAWLTGTATLAAWRGQLDFWVFGDNEVGMVSGSVDGSSQGILPHGLLATVSVRMTVTDRGSPVSVSPPQT